MEYVQLNTGFKVPVLCFGPGMLTRGMKVSEGILGKILYHIDYRYRKYIYENAISSAIELGYRFIDYSVAYGREDIIGKAVNKSGLKRSEFVLTTRIPNQAQFVGNVKDIIYRSLDKFGVDYIDLLMFHWPVKDKYISTWNQMLDLKDEGICRNLGVSNCNIHHIENIINETGEIPAINQVEIHPLFTQKELLEYSNQKGIVLEAYTPLARMDERMVRLPKVKLLAEKYKKTISQLILRWHIQNGIIPVFRSLHKQRQLENMQIFDFMISKEDMLEIDSININSRLRYDPDNCDFSIL